MRFSILGTVLSLLASSAHAQDGLPAATALRVTMPQAVAMERHYPDPQDCGALREAYQRAGWPSGRGIETLRAIDARLKAQMSLRRDSGGDRWVPLGQSVLQAERPAGDCDDVSVTSLQLAVCAGIAPRDLGLLITASPNRAADEVHMIAFYRDRQQKVWVFGDSFGQPRPLSKVRQEVFYFANMTDVTHWFGLMSQDSRKGAGDTASTPLR